MEVLTQEPYFELKDFSKQPCRCGVNAHASDRDCIEEVHYNQSLLQQTKLEFYRHAMHMIAHNKVLGDYWEFGCHKARTFRMAMQEAYRHAFTREQMFFHAFDSFEGLPHDDEGMEEWKKGNLCTSLDDFQRLLEPMPNYKSVVCHKGFYSKTLPEIKLLSTPALICIDCDLYDSAVSVFEFIEPYLKEGTLIYVDDYFVGNMGCQKAFKEFQITSKHIIQEHLAVGWWGKSFIVL